jgi:signal transduction histidine kinase
MPDASVIIIDDEVGIVRLCTRLLERVNYKVTGVNLPSEGIKILQNEQFDLLLVDIRMPEMDGFKVIEQARIMQPDIAVVIMTGFGTLETAIRALRQGADGLILKPFEHSEDLVTAVREALQERQQKQEVARLRAIRPLLSVTESLFSETRYEVLLDQVLTAILGHLRCQHAAIYSRGAGESFLEQVKAIGRALPGEHARAKGGVIGRADHWNIPIWINRDGPGESELKAVMEEFDFSAVICVPVERDGGKYVFSAARNTGEPGFELVDVEMFGLLARQADIALENARLYKELREYVRQIERSQQVLIQAEKMSAVGRLTASFAHEINNPLQAVENCLHLSERDELSKEKRAEYMDMAKDELDRLMNTVQRMLDFYRPGALQKKPTDIEDIIDKVIALLQKQLENQNIVITKKIDKELPEILAVGNQIQQVIFNLVLNAMGAIGQDGEIVIEAGVEKNQVVMYVKDSGPGVPEDVKAHIFEPFISSSDEGTGLGLSVSYGILTAHNGSLELIDSDTGGACFKVMIPLEAS